MEERFGRDRFERAFGQSTLIDADLSVHHMMQGLRNAPGDEIMIIITMFGDGVVMLAVSKPSVWLPAMRCSTGPVPAKYIGVRTRKV